jgi:hypothetical protein
LLASELKAPFQHWWKSKVPKKLNFEITVVMAPKHFIRSLPPSAESWMSTQAQVVPVCAFVMSAVLDMILPVTLTTCPSLTVFISTTAFLTVPEEVLFFGATIKMDPSQRTPIDTRSELLKEG